MAQKHFKWAQAFCSVPLLISFLNINYTLVRAFLYLQAGISGLLK